jgi:hypothetical protein
MLSHAFTAGFDRHWLDDSHGDDCGLVNDPIGYKANLRLAAVGVLAAIACSAPAGAADEQKVLPLLDVTVTAPRPVTPPEKKLLLTGSQVG